MPKKDNTNGDGSGDFSHLKWPAIIMFVLIIVLVVCIDYCSRTGQL